jgi:hypothetical protein
MSARTKARKRALDLLYSADIREIDLPTALADEDVRVAGERDRQASWAYAAEIVQGVIDRREEIDELIETYARDWPLDRMPTVDRALLRLATWEIQSGCPGRRRDQRSGRACAGALHGGLRAIRQRRARPHRRRTLTQRTPRPILGEVDDL